MAQLSVAFVNQDRRMVMPLNFGATCLGLSPLSIPQSKIRLRNGQYGLSSLMFRKAGLSRSIGTIKEHWQGVVCVGALQGGGSERSDDKTNLEKSVDLPGIESGAWMRGRRLTDSSEADPKWEQFAALFRLLYAAGIYGLMAVAGQAICYFTGIDNLGGFNLCPDVAMQGLGYAVPPMMALLFILDDEVVKKSPPARAIRDVEDEELMSFFVGMSPWQFMLVVGMGSVAEELFFRIAVQGGLAHMFLSDKTTAGVTDGIGALTGIFPFFTPFAHAYAAVLTAALTGSILFATSFPEDPTYVVARVIRSRAAQRDLRKSFAAWYERRQLRKIYSPLLDSILALYLGFEWIQTGNVLAPMITHMIYSTVVLGNGLRRIHDQREKLRQRTQTVWQKEKIGSDIKS